MEIIIGKHSVLEVLRAGKRRCREIFISKDRKEKIVEEVESEARRHHVPVRAVDNEELRSLAGGEKHQGLVARVDIFPFTPLADIVAAAIKNPKKGFLLVLDGIMDPHNLGSLIRSAHLMGVDGVILPKDNSCPVSPAVVKTSAGAAEYMPIAEVTNIVSTLKGLKEKDFWVVGAEGSSEQNLYSFSFIGHHYILVLGAEDSGIRRLVKEHCDHLLSIPMLGKIGSYNVSVAGAVFMAEAMRQRVFKC